MKISNVTDYAALKVILEYTSDLSALWSKVHYLLRGSVSVSVLFYEYKIAPTACFRESS